MEQEQKDTTFYELAKLCQKAEEEAESCKRKLEQARIIIHKLQKEIYELTPIDDPTGD